MIAFFGICSKTLTDVNISSLNVLVIKIWSCVQVLFTEGGRGRGRGWGRRQAARRRARLVQTSLKTCKDEFASVFFLENLFPCKSLSGIEERLALPRQPVHLAEARETETEGGRGGAGGVGPPGNRRKARQLEVSELFWWKFYALYAQPLLANILNVAIKGARAVRGSREWKIQSCRQGGALQELAGQF